MLGFEKVCWRSEVQIARHLQIVSECTARNTKRSFADRVAWVVHATHNVEHYFHLFYRFIFWYWAFGRRFSLEVLLYIRYHCLGFIVFNKNLIEFRSFKQPKFLFELIQSITRDKLLVDGAVAILSYLVLEISCNYFILVAGIGWLDRYSCATFKWSFGWQTAAKWLLLFELLFKYFQIWFDNSIVDRIQLRLNNASDVLNFQLGGTLRSCLTKDLFAYIINFFLRWGHTRYWLCLSFGNQVMGRVFLILNVQKTF